MNLAIRGIDASQVAWNNEGPFLNDAHKDLRADFIIANPPFNFSDWSGELLRCDGRWTYGTLWHTADWKCQFRLVATFRILLGS